MGSKTETLRWVYNKHSDGNLDEIQIKFSGFCTNVLRLLFESKHKLSMSDMKIYMNLLLRCSCKNKVFFSFPSYMSLKVQTGLQNSQISKSVKNLQKHGLILCVKARRQYYKNSHNIYIILDLMSQVPYDLAYLRGIYECHTLNDTFETFKTKYLEVKEVFLAFKQKMTDDFNKRTESAKGASHVRTEDKVNVSEKTPPE